MIRERNFRAQLSTEEIPEKPSRVPDDDDRDDDTDDEDLDDDDDDADHPEAADLDGL